MTNPQSLSITISIEVQPEHISKDLLSNAGKAVDPLTVYEHLQRGGEADQAGGLPYLTSLGSYSPSAANIRRYAEIVRERSVLRKLVAASDEIATSAFNPQGRPVAGVVCGSAL